MFTARSQRRIADTVRGFERLNKTTQLDQIRRIRPGSVILTVTPDADIKADAVGECTVHDKDGATSEKVNVRLAFAHSGQKISADKEAFAGHVHGWSDWVFIGAECEDEIPQGAPSDGEIAAAGNDQGTATQISWRVNEVISATVGTAEGVRLPAATQDDDYVIKNNSGVTVKVYPATDDSLNDGATNASENLTDGSTVHYHAVTGVRWIS